MAGGDILPQWDMMSIDGSFTGHCPPLSRVSDGAWLPIEYDGRIGEFGRDGFLVSKQIGSFNTGREIVIWQ